MRYHQFFASCWPPACPKMFELKGKVSLYGGTAPDVKKEKLVAWFRSLQGRRGEDKRSVFCCDLSVCQV